MKEWFKKHLGLVGFGVGMVLFLIELLCRFILKIDHYDLAEIGFGLWISAAHIGEVLNGKYYTKYSEKVKNGWIVFIVALTIVEFFLLLVLL